MSFRSLKTSRSSCLSSNVVRLNTRFWRRSFFVLLWAGRLDQGRKDAPNWICPVLKKNRVANNRHFIYSSVIFCWVVRCWKTISSRSFIRVAAKQNAKSLRKRWRLLSPGLPSEAPKPLSENQPFLVSRLQWAENSTKAGEKNFDSRAALFHACAEGPIWKKYIYL